MPWWPGNAVSHISNEPRKPPKKARATDSTPELLTPPSVKRLPPADQIRWRVSKLAKLQHASIPKRAVKSSSAESLNSDPAATSSFRSSLGTRQPTYLPRPGGDKLLRGCWHPSTSRPFCRTSKKSCVRSNPDVKYGQSCREFRSLIEKHTDEVTFC